jgi:hypothetical protein
MSAVLAVACGSASPPPETTPPVVHIPERPAPTVSSSASATPAPADTTAPGTFPSPDRTALDKLVESFLQAARARSLPGMLACFDDGGRAAESAKGDALTRRFAREGVTVASDKVLSTSTTMQMTGGKVETTATLGLELSIEEGGRALSLTITLAAAKQGDDWYLTEIREGAPPPLAFPFANVSEHAAHELAAKAVSRAADRVVLDVPGGSALPPVGTMVDVYRLAGKGDRGGTAGEYLEGVATGTVAKHEGRKIHIDVTIWPAQVKVGGVVMDYLKKGQPLRIQWSDQRN